MSEHASESILTDSRSDQKLERPRMWRVLLHNDDYTTQEFVVWVLESVFRKPQAEAVEVMMHVHLSGIGVAGIYTHDVAETKLRKTREMAEEQEFPLLVTMTTPRTNVAAATIVSQYAIRSLIQESTLPLAGTATSASETAGFPVSRARMCSPTASAESAPPGPTLESTTAATSSAGLKNASAVKARREPGCSNSPDSG